jgi:sulfate/thiosulfate transport system ATP-binding protein
MTIQTRSISRHHGTFRALDGVSLQVNHGELLALVGPSGSGKTTLLRILAGLDYPDGGAVLFDNEDVTLASTQSRRIGFVFQNYALFEHMTVRENIGFGLSVRPRATRPSSTEIQRRVDELLERVQLPTLGERYPAQLSGGQRQRVALARALAIEPRLLLLDEPFGALDAQVRVAMRAWLRQLQQSLGITSVFVTHDLDEAFQLADRIAVLKDGTLHQLDTPSNILENPGTDFVREFVASARSHAALTPVSGLAAVPAITAEPARSGQAA